MASKRPLFVAAGDRAAATPGPGKRLRAAPGSNSSGPPPSPGKSLRAILLGVLFFLKIRPKGRTIGAIPIPASELGSLALVNAMKDQICQFFQPLWRKLESVEKQIQNVNQKVDRVEEQIRDQTQGNMIRLTHGHHREQLRQETNQEGVSAEPEGFATNRGKGKSTKIRLRFLNGLKTPIFQDDEIKSESNAAIKVAIYDGDHMIESGPLSGVKIEIIALEGNFPYDASDSWTAKEFIEHRASGRDGNGNVLAGKGTTVQLINGKCDLGSIKFREGSCRARERMFIIGARVRDDESIGVRVQEAILSPVVVLDRRNKFKEKSHPPKLQDGVHRLEKISNDGKYFKRLKEKNICTVEDFLKSLNKDPDNLAEILKLKKEHKTWKKMIRHARNCCLKGKHKLKSYTCAEKNVKLFFDCVHCLVGATFSDGHYTPSDKFNTAQQELVGMLKKEAYAELDGLPEDHVMTDSSPDPIHLDTFAGAGAGAGPSYTSSAMKPNCSNQPAADEVGRTVAVGDLVQAQFGPFVIPNMDPAPSSSIHDPQSAHNNPDQGNWPENQDFSLQFLAQLDSNNWRIVESLEVRDQAYAINHGASILRGYAMEQNPTNVAPGSGHLEIQPILWQGNETYEALTFDHNNMALAPYQLAMTGAPGSAQGSLQNQMGAALPSNGASEASTSTQIQRTLSPGQWSQC